MTKGRDITRRSFLGGAVGVAGLAYVMPVRLLSGAPGAIPAILTDDVTLGGGVLPDIAISAERDIDLLLLDFEFYGFEVTPGTPPAITPTSAENVVIVRFPPQAIGEAVYLWQGDDLPVDPPPILSDVSGPSRLCFQLPQDGGIPLPTMSIDDLLDWADWTLLVPATAKVQGPSLFPGTSSPPPAPAPPGQYETAIEFPYALLLSPTVYINNSDVISGFTTTFTSRRTPLVSSGPTPVSDLWSASLGGTSLGVLPQPFPGAPPPTPYVPQIAAVWAVDYGNSFFPIPSDTPEDHINYQGKLT